MQQLPASNVRELTEAHFRGPFYIVICGLHDDPYIAERDVKDCTWAGTVKDIADMQFENLNCVLELATGRDVTKDVAREAMTMWAHESREISYAQYKFVELHVGTGAARSFIRAA